MTKKIFSGFLAVVVLASLVLSVMSATRQNTENAEKKIGVVTVGVVLETPFCVINEDGSFGGVCCEIMSEILGSTGYDVKFKQIVWSEAPELLKAKQINAVVGPITGMLSDGFYNSKPYLSSDYEAVNSDTVEMRLNGVSDLVGKKCAVRAGSGSAMVLYRAGLGTEDVITYISLNDALTAVTSGIVDVAVLDYAFCDAVIRKGGYSGVYENIMLDTAQYCATFGDKTVCDRFNAALESFRENGKLTKIIDKYNNVQAVLY